MSRVKHVPGHTCGPRRLGLGIPVGLRRLGLGIPVGLRRLGPGIPVGRGAWSDLWALVLGQTYGPGANNCFVLVNLDIGAERPPTVEDLKPPVAR